MKLRLPRKLQAWTGIKAFQRSTSYPLNLRQTGTMCGRQFVLKDFHFSGRRNEEITIYTLKLAIDFFFLNNCFNAIDRRFVALSSQPRSFFTKETFQFIESVVERVGQVRGRSCRHATANWPIIQNNDRLTLARQQVGGSQSGDSCTDDAHVRAVVFA